MSKRNKGKHINNQPNDQNNGEASVQLQPDDSEVAAQDDARLGDVQEVAGASESEASASEVLAGGSDEPTPDAEDEAHAASATEEAPVDAATDEAAVNAAAHEAPSEVVAEEPTAGRKKPRKGKGTKVAAAAVDEAQLDAGVSAGTEEVAILDEVPDNVRDLFGADAERGNGSEPAGASDELDGEPFEVEEGVEVLEGERLISVVESLLFASDRLLSLGDLRRLTSVRETKKVQHALDEIKDRHASSGIILVEAGGSFRFQTNPQNVEFVSRIVQGKPIRLSRAMMETLAIVAYKQPITRPEVDDVRGVDCGAVLKTLLDRNLIRVIGKKEDVGRPLLYGTTPEFLKTFNLSDLTELPTLREFHELGAEETAKMKKTFGEDAVPDAPVRASAEGPEAAQAAEAEAAAEAGPTGRVDGLKGDRPSAFSNHTVADVPEDDSLIEELERATEAATRALDAGKSEPGAPVS